MLEEAPQELNTAPGGGVEREDKGLGANPPLTKALKDLNSKLGGGELCQKLAFSMSQRELSALVDDKAHSHLLQATSNTQKLARHKCPESAGTGHWLCTMPG